ncbi:MAG: accessory gene regulator B family protein [Clostridiales bacterium]|nr:accessory gene regulator B family protein [Clostridiales bacterium]
MVHKISEKTIMYAIRNKYIEQEQYEEYLYALEIILNILITDITMIIIGFAMGMIWECIIFWLSYKILRKYCGGYHFGTSLKCYLSSCIMCPVILTVIKYVPYSILVYGIITLTASAILFVLSPVEAANKPLDEKEKRVFGKVARILVFISVVCWSITAIIFNQYILSKVISLSIISVAIFVVAGKIYLTVQKNK